MESRCETVFETPQMLPGEARKIEVPLKGTESLTLRVRRCDEPGASCDNLYFTKFLYPVWAEPQLIR